jgi:NAD-dependent SIR2 family protein deacetylase
MSTRSGKRRYDLSMEEMFEAKIEAAAKVIEAADAMLITAGAGMGVDSGLPDFRGNQGFWKAYPPFERLGVSFIDMANPTWFQRDPELAWGFYGHRLNLYRNTPPHDGFRRIMNWAARTEFGCFVFTSNVDGHFQSAGFEDERIIECHGSIHHLQCCQPCTREIWSAEPVDLAVDAESFNAVGHLPSCSRCGALARPNVLMFGDWNWVPQRTTSQERRLATWLEHVAGSRLVVIELGAGTAVPTVRMTSEHLASRFGATLVRINPREPQVSAGHISLPLGALESLQSIDKHMQ